MAKGMIREFLQGHRIKHPLHPFMVHLPVGLWIGSLVFDIAYISTSTVGFAIAAYYSMMLGLVSILLAVPTGIAEYVSIQVNTRQRRLATAHMTLNIFVSLMYLLNVLSRRAMESGPPSMVTGGQFVLSVVCIMLLGISRLHRRLADLSIWHRFPWAGA
ncbi:MAG: DUF2231 domain-containing protein [Bdellovibrionota bacterium]